MPGRVGTVTPDNVLPDLRRRLGFIGRSDRQRTPTTPSHSGLIHRSILIVMMVVVVIGMIGVAAVVMPVIGHGVSDCRAPDAAHNRADRTADNSPGNRAPDRASDQTVFVGKGNLR